ncbi:hypothetical protein EI555_007544, partial [Monodon monoceros]
EHPLPHPYTSNYQDYQPIYPTSITSVQLTANITAGGLLIPLIGGATLALISISTATAFITFIILILLTILEFAVAIIQAYVFTHPRVLSKAITHQSSKKGFDMGRVLGTNRHSTSKPSRSTAPQHFRATSLWRVYYLSPPQPYGRKSQARTPSPLYYKRHRRSIRINFLHGHRIPLTARLLIHQSHLIASLLCLGGIILSLFVMATLMILNSHFTLPSILPVILFVSAACEATLGLSSLVIVSNIYGTDYATLVPALIIIARLGNQTERLDAGLYFLVCALVSSIRIYPKHCGVSKLLSTPILNPNITQLLIQHLPMTSLHNTFYGKNTPLWPPPLTTQSTHRNPIAG